MWEFPLWEEYLDQVKSTIADVKYLGAPGQAGSIAGGAFLHSFVRENIPWCHFDIAGSAWGDKNLPYQNKGLATGEIIRLVVDLLDICPKFFQPEKMQLNCYMSIQKLIVFAGMH